MTTTIKFVTLENYKKLSPFEQGYVIYMQAEWPESPLKKHQECPYPVSTNEYEQWHNGNKMAMIEVTDLEE